MYPIPVSHINIQLQQKHIKAPSLVSKTFLAQKLPRKLRFLSPEEIPSLPAAAPSAASTLAAALYAGRPLLLRSLERLERLEGWARMVAPAALVERFGERRVPVAQLRQGTLG